MHLCQANTNLEMIMFDPPHKMKNRSLTHTTETSLVTAAGSNELNQLSEHSLQRAQHDCAFLSGNIKYNLKFSPRISVSLPLLWTTDRMMQS